MLNGCKCILGVSLLLGFYQTKLKQTNNYLQVGCVMYHRTQSTVQTSEPDFFLRKIIVFEF